LLRKLGIYNRTVVVAIVPYDFRADLPQISERSRFPDERCQPSGKSRIGNQTRAITPHTGHARPAKRPDLLGVIDQDDSLKTREEDGVIGNILIHFGRKENGRIHPRKRLGRDSFKIQRRCLTEK
jgi:hypothetical protein